MARPTANGRRLMDLRHHLERKRCQRRERRQFRRSTFTRVSTVVKTYGLQDDFVAALESGSYPLCKDRAAQKVPLTMPLWGLVDARQYRVTRMIMAKVDNPYLDYAHTPEEICLSASLYALEPQLPEAELESKHFTALLHGVKERAASKQASDGPPEVEGGGQ